MMSYQKMISVLANTLNQPTKNWTEINDDCCGAYNTNRPIKFKTSMLRSSLCDYSDAYILANGTRTITGARGDDTKRGLDERNKGKVFKTCAPFTDYISE